MDLLAFFYPVLLFCELFTLKMKALIALFFHLTFNLQPTWDFYSLSEDLNLNLGLNRFWSEMLTFEGKTEKENNGDVVLKGTVSRDFRLLFFFMNQFPPSP